MPASATLTIGLPSDVVEGIERGLADAKAGRPWIGWRPRSPPPSGGRAWPVLWSEAALDERDTGMAYFAERQPVTARKVLAEIGKTGDRLGVRAIGRPGRVTGTYEKSVTGRPYIIAYTLAQLPDGGACVAILHVIHTARDWPRGQWPR